MSEIFPDIVSREFAFLEAAGFRVTTRDVERVDYQSERAFVNVLRDRGGELEVYVGRLPRTGRACDRYSLTDMLESEIERKGDGHTPYYVSNDFRALPFIRNVANELRVHGQRALAADEAYFRELETFRSKKAKALALSHVRTQVERAWKERRFQEVVDLYDSFADELTELERRRRDYAKQSM